MLTKYLADTAEIFLNKVNIILGSAAEEITVTNSYILFLSHRKNFNRMNIFAFK